MLHQVLLPPKTHEAFKAEIRQSMHSETMLLVKLLSLEGLIACPTIELRMLLLPMLLQIFFPPKAVGQSLHLSQCSLCSCFKRTDLVLEGKRVRHQRHCIWLPLGRWLRVRLRREGILWGDVKGRKVSWKVRYAAIKYRGNI